MNNKLLSQESIHANEKKQLLTFDMGGTSTDVALIEQQLQLTNQGSIGQYPISVPMVDMHTIGAGGGSIAFIDTGGLLQVGPESTGAKPGPACYDFGGIKATVTDANLVLGRLTSENFLGGEMSLSIKNSLFVIKKLADSLKLSIEETAQGIIDVANEHMSKALRVMSVQKGIDPVNLILMPFGGAGALHVCALADNLNIHKAIIPIHAGVFSAFGMIVAPSSRNLSKTFQQLLSSNNLPQESSNLIKLITEKLVNLEQQGKQELLDEGINKSNIISHFSLDCRYVGQSYTLTIAIDETRLNSVKGDAGKLLLQYCNSFHQEHKKRYGHQHQLGIELVTLRVDVSAHKQKIQLPQIEFNQHKLQKQKINNKIGLPIYQRESLTEKQVITGPALIVEQVSTTYLEKNWCCQRDSYGNLHLDRL